MRHDWVVNRKNEIERLARLYQNPKAAFREVITNSVDAYEEWDIDYAKESGQICTAEKIIKLMIPTDKCDESKIGCLDYATGIKNINEFQKLFESLKKGETFTAGEFGIGRLSLFGLTVDLRGWLEYITNNGDVERVLTVDTTGFDDNDPVSCNNGRLKRRGCCVFVHNVDLSLIPTPKELVKYLSGVFGLRLMRDPRLKIQVNDEKVAINKELESFKKIVPIAEFKYHEGEYDEQKILIEGNIQTYNSGSGSLWVYKKNIRIGNNLKDLGLDYRIKGWINCNHFELTPARDDVIEDDIYDQIKKHIEQYLDKGGFKKIDKDGDDQLSPLKSKNLLNKVSGMIQSVLSNNIFKERFNMPEVVTQQEQEIEVDMWHNPEIEDALRKAKQVADSIGENKGYSLTAGNGAEEGDKIEGFKVDGHERHITPGDGGGIHTTSTVEKGGDIPTISKPTSPPHPRPGTPIDTAFYRGNEQMLKQKQKVMMDIPQPTGLEIVKRPYGDGRPPVFIIGNRFVLNSTNTIFKAAYNTATKDPMGLLFLYSMALAHLFKDYNEVDTKMKDGYVYELVNFFIGNGT